MLEVPELKNVDVAFGNVRHMPKFPDLPEEFQKNWSGDRNKFCHAISQWFYHGASGTSARLVIGENVFTPKEGVDGSKALAAIKAALGSWEPKHEHKIAGCGFMLSEWFDCAPAA